MLMNPNDNEISTELPTLSSDHVCNVQPELEDDNNLSKSKSLTDQVESTTTDLMSQTKSLDNPWEMLIFNWKNPPKLLCSATDEYKDNENEEKYTKGCQWSPDGTCLLVPGADYRARLYELPFELYSGKVPHNFPISPFKPAVEIKEGGLIYDSCWSPNMNSMDPETCYFLTTSKDSPIHLWDAYSGNLKATYRAYNQVDEVEAALSCQFVDYGMTIWAGFKDALRSFDSERPGRQISDVHLKKDFPNAHGIVSCIRDNPIMPGLIAFGTYSKYIGLYKDGPICSFQTDSGVTQIEFSPCGTKLYSALRKSNQFLCWDLRNPGIILYSFQQRQADTNQRIQFSVSSDGTEIMSGGTDGVVKIWKVDGETNSDDVDPRWSHKLSNDCINGVNIHKNLPILATSSGQRVCDENENCRDNSVRLWYCNEKG